MDPAVIARAAQRLLGATLLLLAGACGGGSGTGEQREDALTADAVPGADAQAPMVPAKPSADQPTAAASASDGPVGAAEPGRPVAVPEPGRPAATPDLGVARPLAFDNFQAAEVVIGQGSFSAGEPNQGRSAGDDTLNHPTGAPAITDDGRMWLGDTENGRVLVFHSLPTASGAKAARAVRFVEDGRHAPRPQQVAVAGERLAVVDREGHRVALFGRMPGDATAAPDVVLGQAASAACEPGHLRYPESVSVTAQGQVVVADSGNHRVLVWHNWPSRHGQPPDVVLGQASPSRCAYNDVNEDGKPERAPNAATLHLPTGVWTDGERLVVVDTGNSRVLVWQRMPMRDFQPADVVLGHAAFNGWVRNNGHPDEQPSARSLNAPFLGVSSNGVQLAVADENNHRVLIWNRFPTDHFEPADVVLGQRSFEDNQPNGGAALPSDRVLNRPSGVLFHADSLLVTDTLNHRVLVFRSR